MKLPRWLRWRTQDELDEEIATHIELATQANRERGLAPDAARSAALQRFGNRMRVEESAHEGDPFSAVRAFLQDLGYGVRGLLRNPGFAFAAVASLALGIGANTLIFTLLDAAILKPLNFPAADRLAALWTVPAQKIEQKGSSSVSTFFGIRDKSTSFEAVGAFNGAGCGVRSLGAESNGQPAERLFGQCFSPSLFEILGIRPALGRVFLESEDQVENMAPVVVISYGLWQRRFGGDPEVIGKTISLNREPTTIIGVLPADFHLFRDTNFPATRGADLDFIAPLILARTNVLSRVGGLTIIGRLKPNVTLAQAQAELDLLTAALATSDPDRHQGLGARVEPLQGAAHGGYRSPLLILQGSVGFVLLIACANVAGLLLARTARRHKEVALRFALGANRARVIRQMVAENLPLAILGGAAGVALALGGLALFRAIAPIDFPRIEQVSLDLRVLVFTTLVILATTALFSIAPAMQASRVDLTSAMNESSRSSTGGVRRQRLRGTLVTGQVALAFVLLIGAGLLIHSFMRVVQSDLGGDPTNVLTFDFRLPQSETAKPAGTYRGLGLWEVNPAPAQLFERISDRLRTVPGVVAAAAVNVPPFGGTVLQLPLDIPGRPWPNPGNWQSKPTVNYFAVTKDYFKVMRISLLAGRDFDEHDSADRNLVAIVNQAFVRRFMPGEDPIGKSVALDFVPNEQPREIVGVVGDTAMGRFQDRGDPVMYFAQAQQAKQVTGPLVAFRMGAFFVLKTSGAPMNVLPGVKRAVAELDPNTPVADPRDVSDILNTQLGGLRLYMLLLVLFGATAAVLAATGIYGVMAYSVAGRTREIGIRMAMGACRTDVILMVLREGGRIVGIGVLLGIAGALALGRFVKSILHGTTSTDLATYTTVSALLLVITFLACISPTRRAAAVNPTYALKFE